MKSSSIKITLLILFVAQILFNVTLDVMQYRGDTSPQRKAAVLQYFTEDDISAGAAYNRAGIPARALSILLDAVILILLMLTPASIVLENWCNRVMENRRLPSAALFIAIIFTAYFIITLPFSYYAGFVLEHRFGFSSMSIAFWCWTMLKLGLANLFFLEALFLILMTVIQHFPRTWIIMVPAAILAIRLVSDLLFPYVMIPLFYKSRALPEGNVRAIIETLTMEAGVPVSEIYIIEQSAYSRHTNAYFHGWGKFRKIYLYDTLVKTHDEGQVVTVIAHEMGHAIKNHVLKEHAFSFVIHFFTCVVMYHAFRKLKNGGDIPLLQAHSPSAFPLYLLVFITVGFFSQIATSPLSRHYEREADDYAIKATGDPAAFIAMQKKIAQDNRSRLDPHPAVVFFRYRHPPALERINAARATYRHSDR